MASFPPVRAVVRAIDLLQALNRQPSSTLDALHRQTRIAKPSIVRLLQTLESSGLVRRSPQYGAYALTSLVTTLSCGFHGEPKIVEAAAPLMEELTRRIKWPTTLAVFDADAVVVRYGTIPSSPLALLHSTLNMRLSLVSRALGKAYLAFCTRREQDAILHMLRHSNHPEDAAASNRRAVRRMLAETRRRGYALRDASVRPVSGTPAVPIFGRNRVTAVLGITWFSSVMSPEQMVKTHLGALREASAAISARLAQPPPSTG